MARRFSSLNRRVPVSGEGLSLRRSTRRRQHLKHHSRVRSYRFSKAPNAQLRVEVAARASSPATHLPAIFEAAGRKDGNERMKRAPPSGLSATLTLPPCARMIWLTMARPRPAPSFFSPPPRQNRLKMLSRSCRGTPRHLDPAATIDRHGHFRSRRRVNDRVLNQISQCILERVSVCLHLRWPLASDERNRL